MRRVLMVAYYFPPISATGSMRPLNFCRHLPSYGWEPIVLATDHLSALPPQAADEHLLVRIPVGTEVVRVAHGNPLGLLLAFRDRLSQISIRRSGAAGKTPLRSAKRNSPATNGSSEKRESAVAGARRFVIDALLNFPDPQCRWYGSAVRAMLSRSLDKRPDVIWATGGPWTSLLVGRRLAQQWAVPFIADFRDPWIGGHEFFSSTLLHRRAAHLERAVCEAASRVILNTDELSARFCSEYPQWKHKFLTITNGYAGELRSVPPVEGTLGMNARAEGGDAPTLELCHFGTVYGNRSPIALFRAIQELFTEGMASISRLRLRFVGAWDVKDSECNQSAKALEERGMLKLVPSVSHQECLQDMTRADVLLILQPDYPLQIPAKIYEYIVAGRPLLVIGGEGATANLVQRHRLGRCCPNTVQEIKQTLVSILSSESALLAPAPTDTEQFSYRVLSGRLAELLDRVCEERQGSRNGN